ncbi:MAG: class I SAM-dependent methyltransferase [Pseudomonadota bacterium]
MNINTPNKNTLDAVKLHPSAKGGCRFCNTPLKHSVVDLGNSPLCESFLTRNELFLPEPTYPLHAFVCDECFLVQVEEYVSGEEIFGGEYAYFSSYSTSWLAHAKKFADQIIDRLKLDENSRVVELASNDGYLLKNFIEKGIPVLGVEPADNVAAVAVEKGVPTVVKFFGVKTAKELVADGIQADLMCANNVIAHVPDLNDFVAGMKIILKPTGVITVEFPHLMCLIEGNQFDTIYQEHYCYYSLHTLLKVFDHHGMKIFDVDELATHGGSLRIYACHKEDNTREVSEAVTRIHGTELAKGYDKLEVYEAFAERVRETKRQLLEFLIEANREGKQVAAYGAPGKGNTLLNYCGVRTDFINYTVDRNPFKHGKFLPGTHIPVFDPVKLEETKPDYIVILPWNLKDEIAAQLEYTREWGAKLVVPIPELTVF